MYFNTCTFSPRFFCWFSSNSQIDILAYELDHRLSFPFFGATGHYQEGHHKQSYHNEVKPERPNGEVQENPKSKLSKDIGKRHCTLPFRTQIF